jgi:hypothetical protein
MGAEWQRKEKGEEVKGARKKEKSVVHDERKERRW